MDPLVREFIAIVDPSQNISLSDKNIFWLLVNARSGNGRPIMDFVAQHPEVLVRKLRNNLVFDFFYEKVILDKCHPVHSDRWQNHLIECIKLLDLTPCPDIIKRNKIYMLKLQSTYRTLIKIFTCMVNQDFDMGDPEFLVYSIIARGELDKLKVLCSTYVIEDYPAVLDVALRFGRHSIIDYFIHTLHLEVKFYGKIVDFENYKDNCRYLYYREHISQDYMIKHKPIVGASRQNYAASLSYILKDYDYTITHRTIQTWCDLIRAKEYLWDKVNPAEVLTLLLDRVETPVPLSMDFKEFNDVIFGREWSDRTYLIKYCKDLQAKLDDITDRYNVVLNKLGAVQARCDMYEQMHQRRDRRVRRETIN